MTRKFLRILSLALVCALAAGVVGTASAADTSTYRSLYSGEVTTLNYLTTASTNEFSVAANIIDTLVEYDQYGQIQPSLAESWENSEDGLTWTFHLRKASWVKADGSYYADVTANDFVFAAKYILNAQNASSTADILYGVIAGAEDYYKGTQTPAEGEEAAPVMDWETVGIKALDDLTVEYTLIHPVPYFLSMVTYVCFMPANEQFVTELGDGFGLATGNDTVLYCGAYILSEFKPQEKRVYTVNPAYWDKEKVYVTTIDETYNASASEVSAQMYLNGEIDSASITNAVAADWLLDPEKADLIHPVRQSSFYSYWYSFNFDPKFDEEYEPANWKLAVNNENFRQSIAKGFDRVKAMLITDPDNAESLLWNTVTPRDFVSFNGKDFTEFGDVAPITALGAATFDAEAALAYRDAAMEELAAAGATFPVKMLMQYNPSVSGWADECQVVEQQLEELLGSDYIDIIVVAGPTQGFLSAVRRSGQFAFMKTNWGPDYADPETYSDPFTESSTYLYLPAAEDKEAISTYYAMVEAAKAITDDIAARYEAFAAAEAYLINHAYLVPFGPGNGGYTASRLDPFTAQYAPFGLSSERYKGMKMLEKPMNTEEYWDAYDEWQDARAAFAE